MRWRLSLWLTCAFIGAATAWATAQQVRPDFGGAWTIVGGLRGTEPQPSTGSGLTIIDTGTAITIMNASGTQTRACRFDGTLALSTYAVGSPGAVERVWTVQSSCRWLGYALVAEETHTNASTGQRWQALHTYSLDVQTKNLVETIVGAELTTGPYMSTQTLIYRKAER